MEAKRQARHWGQGHSHWGGPFPQTQSLSKHMRPFRNILDPNHNSYPALSGDMIIIWQAGKGFWTKTLATIIITCTFLVVNGFSSFFCLENSITTKCIHLPLKGSGLLKQNPQEIVLECEILWLSQINHKLYKIKSNFLAFQHWPSNGCIPFKDQMLTTLQYMNPARII